MLPQAPEGGLVRHVVTFGRILREAGLEVGPGRISDALCGLDRVDIGRSDDVYWALRTTLVSNADDLESFDKAFAAWFLRSPSPPQYRNLKPSDPTKALTERMRTDGTGPADRDRDKPTEVGWSAHEVLRRKDFGSMTDEEFARVAKAIADVATTRPLRRSRRLRPDSRGRRLDLRRLARRSLARGGDPIERTFRRRIEVPRKLIVVCDVSGS
ncbi:MAG TPA: VWA domain-containing protein, partial [Gaiellaceae bacterium]